MTELSPEHYKEQCYILEQQLLALQKENEELKARVKAEFDIAHEKIEQWAKIKIEFDELTARHQRLVEGLRATAIRCLYDSHGSYGESYDVLLKKDIDKLLEGE